MDLVIGLAPVKHVLLRLLLQQLAGSAKVTISRPKMQVDRV
jgi:hypothetical protein